MKTTLPDGTTAHIRVTANPIAGRPATRQDLLYALDQDLPENSATIPLTGTGFAIVCLQCGTQHASIWMNSRDGEYDGNTIKCGKCGQREDV